MSIPRNLGNFADNVNSNGKVEVTGINATGTPSGSTVLYGNGTWASVGGGGSAATPTALGTVYGGTTNSGTVLTTFLGYQAGNSVGGGSYPADTFIGYQSGYSTTTGYQNSAVGASSLYSNVSGTNNAAFGSNALYYNTASSNTAVGSNALFNNTTASYNVAIGQGAGFTNTTGTDNVVVGMNAFYFNTTGSSNTAIGRAALNSNTIASYNTVIGSGAMSTANSVYAANSSVVGYQAALNTTTGGNFAVLGYRALYSNTTGNDHVAIGVNALYGVTSGSNNIGIGLDAGKNITTGGGNTVIGTSISGGTYRPVFDVTTESNRFVAGHTSVSNAYVNVSWTIVSDARDKTNFAPITHGLNFVNQLNPIAYQFKETRESDVAHGPVRYGFKAQEVLELEGSNPVIVDNTDNDKLRMTDTYMIPILVKAIQELKAELDAYKASHS